MSNTNNGDNFDSPDDFDQDQVADDRDVDFDDFEDSKDRTAGNSWKNSPLFKFGVVGIVVIIVIALISILTSDEVAAPTSFVGKGAGENFKQAPGTAVVSPVMKEALEEKNEQRIDEAQKQGMSAIPTPITPPKTLLEVPQDDAQSEDPLLRWQQMQTERAKAQREQQLMQDQQSQVDPNRESKVQALQTAMTQQMSTILGQLKAPEMEHMDVFMPIEGGGAMGAAVAGGVMNVSGNDAYGAAALAMQNTTPAKVIVPAGRIEYAQNLLEANSDIPGPVVALLASGQFSGAKLIGSFQSQEEYLVITFRTLVTKKGTSIPINAYAIDPGTSLTGLATEVDHRYWRRIILPAAARFVEGLGEAYAETTTSTSQNSTTTVTSSEDLDTKQEFGKAVSEMASSIGEVLDEDASNTDPLIIVSAGAPMGILFMESVTDKTVLQARTGVAGGSQMNGQPNNPYSLLNGQQQLVQQQQQMNNNNSLLNQLQQLQNGLQNQQFMQQQMNAGYNSGYGSTVPAGTTTSTGQ